MLRYRGILLSALISLLSLSAYHLSAQNLTATQVMADKNYVYEIGVGATLEEADRAALKNLATRSAQIISNDSKYIEEVFKNKTGQYVEVSKDQLAVISNVYLDNVGRVVVSQNDVECKVMRYMTKDDFAHRFDACIEQIKSYVTSAQYALKDSKPDEAIKDFAWAFALTKSCPVEIEMDGITGGVSQYCSVSIEEILKSIDVKVIGIEKDENNQTYPYQVFVDITWKPKGTSKPQKVDFLTFHYFDGGGFVSDQEVKDGRAVLDMQTLPEAFDFQIECVYMDYARILDQRVASILESQENLRTFKGALKKVETQPKHVKPSTKPFDPKKSAPSIVDKEIEDGHNTHAAFTIDTEVSKKDQYLGMLEEIEDSIRKGSYAALRDYFTDEAWDEFNQIVASGSPKIVRKPDFRMIRLDTLVMARSIPLKLKFKGNRTFVEDVAFRISANSDKIVGVSYTLSSRTEDQIMSMQWEDRARILLLNFLEDYRTAYCLKNLEYIDKIFANDAYIITGKVLKQRPSMETDRAQVNLAKDVVEYQTKSKSEYIASLKESFRSKEFVNIRFDECEAAKGYNAKEGMYAVQMRQHYYSNNYADEGWLTLAIDMRQEKDPLIKVRVWQQDRNSEYNAETMIEKTISVGNQIPTI